MLRQAGIGVEGEPGSDEAHAKEPTTLTIIVPQGKADPEEAGRGDIDPVRPAAPMPPPRKTRRVWIMVSVRLEATPRLTAATGNAFSMAT